MNVPHFRPILRPTVLLKLGADISGLILGLALIWGDQNLVEKRVWTTILSLIFLVVAWVVVRAPYCYFIPHPTSLNKGSKILKFERHSTGYIPKLRHSVVRFGADIIAKPNDLLIADKLVEDIAGVQSADISIPLDSKAHQVDLDFQCTAAEDGWKQRVTLGRRPDGSLSLVRPIAIRPDFTLGWNIYPERRFDARALFVYVPAFAISLTLVIWASRGQMSAASPVATEPPSRPITDLRFGINTHWVNLGPEVAHDVVSSSDVGIVITPISPEREDIEYRLFRLTDGATENDPKDYGLQQGVVQTINGDSLTDQILSDLSSHPPKRVLYVFGHIRFKDTNGVHEVDLCDWLQMPLQGTGVWHQCHGHNVVTGNPATNVQFDAVGVRLVP